MKIDKEKIVRGKKGVFVKREDGAYIAGFYNGTDPLFSDDNTVWCPFCIEKAPEASSDFKINPIIKKMKIEDYGDPRKPPKDRDAGYDKVENDVSDIECDECGQNLPVQDR